MCSTDRKEPAGERSLAKGVQSKRIHLPQGSTDLTPTRAGWQPLWWHQDPSRGGTK
ncbi:hypothetical protein SO694_0001320 [Aureococcus anophagefferens]|uniref:Uncharacterized protein n=1 Tax=Aureococcus anophagefferens TaxID=44056 RepID=A0ABR1G1V4_AURAN